MSSARGRDLSSVRGPFARIVTNRQTGVKPDIFGDLETHRNILHTEKLKGDKSAPDEVCGVSSAAPAPTLLSLRYVALGRPRPTPRPLRGLPPAPATPAASGCSAPSARLRLPPHGCRPLGRLWRTTRAPDGTGAGGAWLTSTLFLPAHPRAGAKVSRINKLILRKSV